MTNNWDNSYFNGLIESKNSSVTYKATQGVMHQGELPNVIEANAGREQITVTSGVLSFKSETATEWQVINTGETIIIPAGTKFLWRVDSGEMQYACVYLDQPIQ